MKATLEFNLPEEKEEFDTAVNANAYRSVLCEFDGQLRKILKYEESITDEMKGTLQGLRDTLNEMARDEGIEI